MSLRRKLVKELEKSRCIKTAPVRRAFHAVPREVFIPDHLRSGGLEAVYRDQALVTKTDAKGAAVSSSSQPAIMAVMLEALRLRKGLSVLEVGAGTGYNAALLSTIVGSRGHVTAIDIDPDLVAAAKKALRKARVRASLIAGDGRNGWATNAPYDRVIVTASTDAIPRAWWEQLSDGGLLEVPFRLVEGLLGQSIVVFERTADGLRSVDSNPGGFMALRTASDEGAPLAQATRAVGAYEAHGSKSSAFGYLSGSCLGRAGRDGRELLAKLLLAEPRVQDVVAKRSQGNALQTFLTLGFPRQWVVHYGRHRFWGVGVMSPELDGFSVAVRRSNGPTSIRSFGSRAAEGMMKGLLEEWQELGSPGDKKLEISVSFDRRPKAWRVLSRNGSFVGVDWGRR